MIDPSSFSDPTQDYGSSYDPTMYGNIDPSYFAYLYGGAGSDASGMGDPNQIDLSAYSPETPEVQAPLAPVQSDTSGDPASDLGAFSSVDNSSLFPALPSDYYASYYNQGAVNPAPENSSDYSQMYEPFQGYDTVDPSSFLANNSYPNESVSPAYGSFGTHPVSGPAPSY